VQSRGLDYVFNMPVKKPGAYQFRVAVINPSSGHVGSAGQFVEVPDIKKERLAISGLVVRGATASEAAGSAPGLTIADAADGAAPVQETEATPALRRFRPQMLLDYTYLIFHARTAKGATGPRLTARTQLFREGRPVFDRESPVEIAQQLDPMRAVSGGRLRLGDDLPPGEYVLQLTVTDPLADKDRQTAMQWVDFEIVK
jgi:hypothetical protein